MKAPIPASGIKRASALGRVLVALHVTPDVDLGDLARELGIPKGTASSAVACGRGDGLITAAPRRALTAKGMRAIERLSDEAPKNVGRTGGVRDASPPRARIKRVPTPTQSAPARDGELAVLVTAGEITDLSNAVATLGAFLARAKDAKPIADRIRDLAGTVTLADLLARLSPQAEAAPKSPRAPAKRTAKKAVQPTDVESEAADEPAPESAEDEPEPATAPSSERPSYGEQVDEEELEEDDEDTGDDSEEDDEPEDERPIHDPTPARRVTPRTSIDSVKDAHFEVIAHDKKTVVAEALDMPSAQAIQRRKKAWGVRRKVDGEIMSRVS